MRGVETGDSTNRPYDGYVQAILDPAAYWIGRGGWSHLGAGVDLDVGDPLDPLEATLAARGEPEGVPVSTG